MVIKLTILIVSLHAFIGQISGTTFVWSNEGPASWQRPLHGNVPICVDIPVNLSLCHGIGYTKMRLPNLLHHDSLQEVSQQAVSWIPLFRLGCHPDTQLFLCSLFTPVCLDHPIPPCRSLCKSVQSSCESTMIKYGYPWPHIVHCDQFPVDNDMCIQAQHSGVKTTSSFGTSSSPSSGSTSPSLNSFPHATRGEKEKTKKRRKHRNHSGPQGEQRTPELARTDESKSEVHADGQLPSKQLGSDQKPKGPSKPNEIFGSGMKGNKERHNEVFNNMLTNYCYAEWSLKARATFEVSSNKTTRLKTKNYRVIHGNFSSSSKEVVLEVPANISRALEQSKMTNSGRHRYYIMGRSNQVNYMLPWPHKLGQFRKALKLIRNNSVQCESHAAIKSPDSQIDESQKEGGEPREKRRERTGKGRKEHRRRQHKSRTGD